MLRYNVAVLAALVSFVAAEPCRSQSLEESVLTLHRSGAALGIRQDGPGVVVASDINLEARVVDAAACSVRITDLNRPAYKTIRGEWDDKPATPSPNTDGLYRELYLGRVVAADIKKVPQVLGTRNGVVVEQIVDGKWRLAGSPGDDLWCIFWPDGRKSCSDSIEFERMSVIRNLPDQEERTTRVDRALVHVYADLCKGAAKRVPF